MHNRYYLSIEIGGTKLQLIVYSQSAQAEKHLRYAIERDKGAAGIREQIQEGIAEITREFQITQTGVGFGGPVDRHSGVIGVSHQIGGWSGFPLAEWLEGLTGSKAIVQNDANTAALGEAVFGAGKDYHTVFYMTIGSGIGGGLVQARQLYHGRAQGESEVGHLRLNERGDTLEALCAGWAVDEQVRQATVNYPDSILARWVPSEKIGGEARFLVPALDENCPVAAELLDTLAARLSLGLSHVVHLFNPDIVILGGGVSLIGEPLRNRIEAKLPQLVLKALHPVPVVAIAALGEDVVPMGALALCLSASHH